MTYTAYVTRIKNVRKHPDPETHSLQVAECFGNQVIVGLNTKTDDIGIYFQSDGRLSDEFLTNNNLVRKVDPATGKNVGGLFDANGKVRTQKLRGEKSDGFFCPLEFLTYTGVDIKTLDVGFAFTEINGHKICEKFITTKTMGSRGDKKPREKTKFPLFYEHIDTEQLAYKMDELKDDMFLVFTEKLHGTSQRSAYSLEEKQLWYGKLINGIFKRMVIPPHKEYNYVCGTRRVVLKDFETHVGFYKENEMFRKYAHDKFLNKLHKGETIYYEVVGYAGEKTPIMNTCDNTKLKDKEFVKTYGKTTTFNYGCPPGHHEVYVYRITMTNEDGNVVDLSWDGVKHRCGQLGVNHVPELSRMIYYAPMSHEDKEEHKNNFLHGECDLYACGSSTIDPSHLREGIVVRADGSKWEAWKYKSFQFKVLEDIIKLQDDAIDIEESQEVV
jgi:hypothetical protein